MIQRLRKTKDPCSVCYLHKERCICHLIPALQLSTRVCLVIHAKELKRTTNTGRLALKALLNSEMRVRGENRMDLDLSDLLTETHATWLLYPSEDALELNETLVKSCAKPIQLIVPDGNWRQAGKVHYRHKELRSVQRVCVKKIISKIPQKDMRTETKADGMATLEAIAQALRVIEGESVFEALMRLYNAKKMQTLLGRGQL